MAANPNPAPAPLFIVLIDGDGHHTINGIDELTARVMDLVMSNEEITFKKSEHGGEGFPRMLILEVS